MHDVSVVPRMKSGLCLSAGVCVCVYVCVLSQTARSVEGPLAPDISSGLADYSHYRIYILNNANWITVRRVKRRPQLPDSSPPAPKHYQSGSAHSWARRLRSAVSTAGPLQFYSGGKSGCLLLTGVSAAAERSVLDGRLEGRLGAGEVSAGCGRRRRCREIGLDYPVYSG